MSRIRLYRHPACDKCARYASIHRRLDWLGRLEDSTQMPPTGSLRVGEIAVMDLTTLDVHKGVEAFRLLCRHIPAYWLLLPLSYIPAVRRRIEHEMGCTADSCSTDGAAMQH